MNTQISSDSVVTDLMRDADFDPSSILLQLDSECMSEIIITVK